MARIVDSDLEIDLSIRSLVRTYGLHEEWNIGGRRCCTMAELDAAIAYEIRQRREHNTTNMIVTTGRFASPPGVFLPVAQE